MVYSDLKKRLHAGISGFVLFTALVIFDIEGIKHFPLYNQERLTTYTRGLLVLLFIVSIILIFSSLMELTTLESGYGRKYLKSIFESKESKDIIKIMVPVGAQDKFVDVHINICGLSEPTQEKMKLILEPLYDLYKIALSSDWAYARFRTYGGYLETIGHDIKHSVAACNGENSEQILIDRLEIVIDCLSKIIHNVENDIENTKYKELTDLWQKSKTEAPKNEYKPFSLTEEIGKLL